MTYKVPDSDMSGQNVVDSNTCHGCVELEKENETLATTLKLANDMLAENWATVAALSARVDKYYKRYRELLEHPQINAAALKTRLDEVKAEERAAVVMWLRKEGESLNVCLGYGVMYADALVDAANFIEAGEHLCKGEPNADRTSWDNDEERAVSARELARELLELRTKDDQAAEAWRTLGREEERERCISVVQGFYDTSDWADDWGRDALVNQIVNEIKYFCGG